MFRRCWLLYWFYPRKVNIRDESWGVHFLFLFFLFGYLIARSLVFPRASRARFVLCLCTHVRIFIERSIPLVSLLMIGRLGKVVVSWTTNTGDIKFGVGSSAKRPV